jgi:hypothetical protein
MDWTDGKGVDVVMDNVGGEWIEKSFSAVAHYGHFVTLLLPDKETDWSVARQRNIGIHLEIMLSPLLFGLQDAQKHQTFILEECARYFDDEIAGLVLVDSSHDEQVYRLPENGKNVVRRSLHQDRSNMVTKAVLHEHYPEEEAEVAQQLMSRWSAMLTWREEMANYALSARELRDLHHGPILQIPIVVVTRGKRVWPDTPYGDAMEAAWTELQNELNYMSGNSTQVIAENSGHVIHLDEPELVVDAIHDVLDIVMKDIDEQGG